MNGIKGKANTNEFEPFQTGQTKKRRGKKIQTYDNRKQRKK